MGALKLSYNENNISVNDSDYSFLRVVAKNGKSITPSLNSYVGGMEMPGRSVGQDYKYGMNGQEKDDEISGSSGTHYTAEHWEYDTRIAKRWNVDPKASEFPHQSPYAAFNDNPILYKDPSGAKGEPVNEKLNGILEAAGSAASSSGSSEGLTTTKLRELARGAGVTGTGVDFNRKVGKAFETIALTEFNALGRATGHSTPDRFAKYGVGATTIPDASTNINIIFSRGNKYGKETISNASLYEVKAYAGVLKLGTSRGQIKSIIDIAARANSNLGGMPAAVTFITTADTFISDEVVNYATTKNVNLFQAVAGLDSDGNMIFSYPMQQNNTGHQSPGLKLDQLNFHYPTNLIGNLQNIPQSPTDADPETVEGD